MRVDDNGLRHALSRGGRRDRPGPRGSYEEYFPHGATSWWAGSSSLVGQKRYKYTGMERDEETGLQRHGVRYYAGWLGRWVSSDPIGLGGGINRYGYCSGDPVAARDISGLADYYVVHLLASGKLENESDLYTPACR